MAIEKSYTRKIILKPHDRAELSDRGNDPFASFCFQAEIDSKKVSGFSEVSGLTIETEVETFREGGVNTQNWQLPGPAKFPTRLTLKRGLANKDALWSWYRNIMAGRIERKQVTIILMDNGGDEKWQWVFDKASKAMASIRPRRAS